MKVKVFISQPMSQYSFEEILKNRNIAIDQVIENFDDYDVEIIDNLQDTNPDAEACTHPSLYYLGNDIKDLANADVAYFTKGWSKARGCLVEHACALAYGVEVCYEDEENHE